MCKRLFKALKIKMDNYHLRYALAGAEEKIEVLEEKLKNSIVLPKLEKHLGHKGWWILYSLDDKGDITWESFEATKKEAEKRLKEVKNGKLF